MSYLYLVKSKIKALKELRDRAKKLKSLSAQSIQALEEIIVEYETVMLREEMKDDKKSKNAKKSS